MLDPQLLATLRSLPLFAGLPPAQLERLARITRVSRYDPGAVVFRQWEVARGFYMLLSGRGQLIQQGTDGGQRLLADVVPNQYFNEAALVTELVEQATFVITAPALVLHIARPDYLTNFGPTLPMIKNQVPQPAGFVPPAGRNDVPPAPSTSARAPAPPAQTARPPAASSSQAGLARASQSSRNAPSWLNPGETILLQTRRHWWAAFRNIWLPLLFFAAVMVAALLIDSTLAKVFLFLLAFIVPGGMILYFILDWRNDWLVITDERVLRVEQIVARFSLQTNEVGLLSVQGVSASLPAGDPVSRVLRYGNVVISTAGSAGNITMDFVPHPSRIKDYIFHQREIKMRAAQNGNNNIPQTPDSQGGHIHEPDTFPSDDVGRRSVPFSGGGLFSMRYVNQKGDIVYRRHLIVWARHIFWPLLAMIVCGMLLLFGPRIEAFRDAGVIAQAIAIGGIVISFVWLYLADWDWRNDLYIIGEGVVTILHRSPFLLQFREDQVLIQRIHNIEAETTGLLRSLLDYGDVRVLLLGDDKPKVFRDVPGPVGVREEISRRQREAAEEARKEEEQRQLDAVVERMKQQGMIPPANNAVLPNPAQQQPAPGQVPPGTEYRPPVQPQRPPIPRRRV
jgi:uncharacterized membrane protein